MTDVPNLFKFLVELVRIPEVILGYEVRVAGSRSVFISVSFVCFRIRPAGDLLTSNLFNVPFLWHICLAAFICIFVFVRSCI